MSNELATTIAAWFGAFGTVGLTLFEVYKYLNDKPKLKISTRFNQELYTEYVDGKLEKDKVQGTVWTINLANNGSKAIIVTSVAVENHKGKNALITQDSVGNRINRYKLEPGDSTSLTISEKLLDSKNLKTVVVTSAVGKEYRERVYFWQKK